MEGRSLFSRSSIAHQQSSLLTTVFVILLSLVIGCRAKDRSDLDYSYEVLQTVSVDEFTGSQLVQFEQVFWEPDDTESLRQLIVKDQIANGRKVLEIGTGTGLLSLLCLQEGASSVVATDINPVAIANARYNAAMLELEENLDVRAVTADDSGAFSVIKSDERFDLILSNPPWEDGSVSKPLDHAFYDPGFALMDSLLEGLATHLNPSGRCLLAYGHVPAISRLLSRAKASGFQVKVLDDRKLDELPQDFLPGMLVEVRLGKNQIPKVEAGGVKTEVENDLQQGELSGKKKL